MNIFDKFAPFAVLACVLVFAGCHASQSAVPQYAAVEAEAEEQILKRYLVMVAAGDNLTHCIIFNRARTSDGRFDFNSSFDRIRPIIQNADIAFVNQETVMGGTQFGYTGWPLFNSPQEMGLALINAGFNVINLSHNHSMDRGQDALLGTMDFFDYHDVMYLGVFRTEKARSERRIMEKNGIRVGFLAYTFSLNGLPLPPDKPWLVALIDRDVMAREIAGLRPYCDILVVSMHWGDEFTHVPSAGQRALANFMAEHNVDIILGHHPHVIQPLEFIERPDGGTLTVFYSLGDLLSHTHSRHTPNTIAGALAYIRIKKTWENGASTAAVDFAGVIPTVSHYSRAISPFVVYPLWDYTEELASSHGVGMASAFNLDWDITLDHLYSINRDIFGEHLISREKYEYLRQFMAQVCLKNH